MGGKEREDDWSIGVKWDDIFWNAINTELFDVCASRASSQWFVFII